MSGPLDGVRVLDLTRLLPGGYCTLALADLGADVVKIEQPGRGDYIRAVPPLVDGVSAYHRALNRGKRSMALDLKAPEGPGVLRRLVRDADLLVESFRPGVMERLGAAYGSLVEENPRLVYCAITGYGQDGPYRDRAGHDLDYVAYAGILDSTGEPGGPPVLPGVQVADLAGGMAAAIGMLACLHEASRTGRGRFVDAAMLDAAVSWLGMLLPACLATGSPPPRGGTDLTGGLACYRAYAAADGRWLVVAALEPGFWKTLCEAMSLPELVGEHRAPAQRQEEIASRLAEVFATRPQAEWVEKLSGLEACVAPVNDLGEVLADPQVRHREMVAEVDGEQVGPGPFLKLSGWRPEPSRPAPSLGEHTSEILGEAGLPPPRPGHPPGGRSS